ncbi:MAG: ABC transporter ATP-binding protein [Desulfovibrio sp.]|jgi:ABC-type Fe3+/spermidine/putrescine transport system ATPase subunit|nr:ABC transporter ATP-binding protein [Desulfovibrio sp.]
MNKTPGTPAAQSLQSAQAGADSAEIVVFLADLRKSYGNFDAVKDFTLNIHKGELVCLLGPSGCGKTTTLRMIAGFIEPTSGRIEISGQDVSLLPPYKRDTGMVFQSYALFPHMSVEANVAFGLENLGIAPDKRKNRVLEMLQLVELEHLAGRYPKELSGGQQQRVALARALALHPAVLLLDEPFSNLDAQLRIRLREELRKLIGRVNITTIFVTHDQEEALMLSDRIVVMRNGGIEQIGTPEDIYENPGTRFVAEFIGNCSLLQGMVKDGVFTSETGLSIPAPGRKDGNCLLVLRPEYIRPASGKALGQRYAGLVESSDYYGSLTRIMLSVGRDSFLLEAHFPPGTRPRKGDRLELEIDPHGVRFVEA